MKIKDSYRFFPRKLSDLTEKNIEYKKLTEEFDHKSVTKECIYKNDEFKKVCLKYLKHDVLGMTEAINLFNDTFKEEL